MSADHSERVILCLACASLYPDAGMDPLTCPACGHSVDRSRYERIENYAADAAHYGHCYREIYEAQGIATKYALAPDDALRFAAMAVLSGITYDLLKLVVRKIVQSSAATRNTRRRDLDDGQQLAIFVAHVRSFRDGMPDASDEIRQECRNEMYVDAYARAMVPLTVEVVLHGGAPPTEDQIKAALSTARAEVDSREVPHADDFGGCWVKVSVGKRSEEPPAA